MDVVAAVAAGFRGYARFSGRSARRPFWYWILFHYACTVVALVVDLVAGLRVSAGSYPFMYRSGVLEILVTLVLFVPTLAFLARRAHDNDHSAWWLLVPIVPLAFAFLDSQPGPNRYGPNPLGREWVPFPPHG